MNPGTVNSPGVMIFSGQALPRVHIKLLLGNVFYTLVMSMRKTTLAPGKLLRSVHM